MNKLFVLSLLLIFLGCAGPKFTDFWTGKPSKTLGYEKDSLTEEDQEQLRFVKERGEMLKEYDYFSWIGSDIFSEQYDINRNPDSITGWVYQKENGIPTVYFGQLKDTVFHIRWTIKWEENYHRIIQKSYEISEISNMAYAQALAIKLNAIYLNRNHLRTNTYAFKTDGGIDIYLIAATTSSDVALFGGSVKTKFDLTGREVIHNELLHLSTIAVNLQKKERFLVRSSSMGSLYNEVDYFQSYLYMNVFPVQYIVIESVPRIISFVVDGSKPPEFLVLKDKSRKVK